MFDFGVSMCVTVCAGVHANTHTHMHAWKMDYFTHTDPNNFSWFPN